MVRSRMFLGAVLAILIVLGLGVSLGNGSTLSPGDILVADQGTGTIRHYSAIGTDLGAFASGLASPSWIAADTSGNVYVSEYGGNRVRKFSPSGATLLAITTAYTPGGVAIGGDGTIIKKFSPMGTDLGTFATLGDPGSAYGMVFDGEGNLYAANFAAANIRKYSPAGVDLGMFASVGLAGPRDLVVVPFGGPTSKDECKDGGWEAFDFPRTFKNQGDCIQFVETGK
jgi:hypothetical protein